MDIFGPEDLNDGASFGLGYEEVDELLAHQ